MKVFVHVLNAIEGYLVIGYEDGGDAPFKQLKLVKGALNDAQRFLENENETQKHLQRVSELVEGFESPYDLELLATVHWIVQREGVSSAEEIPRHVYAWNLRKKQFTNRQIEIARRILEQKGWFDSSEHPRHLTPHLPRHSYSVNEF